MFEDNDLGFGALPSALRKVMSNKFPEFDAYQLGEYLFSWHIYFINGDNGLIAQRSASDDN